MKSFLIFFLFFGLSVRACVPPSDGPGPAGPVNAFGPRVKSEEPPARQYYCQSGKIIEGLEDISGEIPDETKQCLKEAERLVRKHCSRDVVHVFPEKFGEDVIEDKCDGMSCSECAEKLLELEMEKHNSSEE